MVTSITAAKPRSSEALYTVLNKPLSGPTMNSKKSPTGLEGDDSASRAGSGASQAEGLESTFSRHEKSLSQMLDQLVAWGGALKTLRK